MSKKKITIIICTAIIIILCAAAAIILMPHSSVVSVTEMLSTAQKYLIETDYERAIAEFNKVIELDPMNAEAYLGLAEAYEKNGQHDMAVETLEKGYEVTGDERLKALLWSSFENNDIELGICYAIDNYECRIWFELNNERIVNSVWCHNSFEYYINATTAKTSSGSTFNTETSFYYSEDNTYCGKEEIITDSTNQLICVNYYDENNNLMHKYTFKSEISDDNVVHTFQYENDDLLVSESIYYSEKHYELLMYNSSKQVIEKKEFIAD